MLNKILSLITLSALISVPSTVLAQGQPQCQLPEVFCLEEFNSLAQGQSSIEDLVQALPFHVKRNATFKRGNNIEKQTVGILGPHGHKVSSSNSGSASPTHPRAFVWDETTGFTASWNSGNHPSHSAQNRIDLYDFDFEKMEHRLTAWFPNAVNGKNFHGANFKDSSGRTCTKCHGDNQRPIFPMYPDWPQFFGEFNDEMAGYPAGANAIRSDLREMANKFQPIERDLFAKFLNGEGSTNKRYTPLFAVKPDNNNHYYPYRPATTTSPFLNVSRAFYHRPNLRLGVVYNRLTALQTFEKIKKSPIFKKFPDIIFYSMLDCNWDYVEGAGQTGRAQILDPLVAEARTIPGLEDINLRGAAFQENGQTTYKHHGYKEVGYQQIPYEDLLRLLNLKIQDMDIRYRHDSSMKVAAGYNVYDPRAYYTTDNAMDIGYTEDTYPMNPTCNNSGSACNFSYDGTYMEGMKYFNSYFDGSATMNELLAAQMLKYLTDSNQDFSQDPDLAEVRANIRENIPNPNIYFETLKKKYDHFTARYALDKPFFDKMDAMSPWIQLPYPPDLLNIQNRESFWRGSNASCTREVCERHAQWTTRANRRNNVQNKNSGNNICWNVYTSLHKRYRQ